MTPDHGSLACGLGSAWRPSLRGRGCAAGRRRLASSSSSPSPPCASSPARWPARLLAWRCACRSRLALSLALPALGGVCASRRTHAAVGASRRRTGDIAAGGCGAVLREQVSCQAAKAGGSGRTHDDAMEAVDEGLGGGTGGLMAGLARTSAKLRALESSISGQHGGYSSGELLAQLKHEQKAQLDREVPFLVLSPPPLSACFLYVFLRAACISESLCAICMLLCFNLPIPRSHQQPEVV